MEQYAISMETNPLVAIREELRGWRGPARMVWGLNDALFGVQWAEWLDRTLPGSRGVRRIEGANLFFPEEMPELIAEEAMRLWGVQR
jgi:pimeloyl-ACP methyl ester carboxylesterase